MPTSLQFISISLHFCNFIAFPCFCFWCWLLLFWLCLHIPTFPLRADPFLFSLCRDLVASIFIWRTFVVTNFVSVRLWPELSPATTNPMAIFSSSHFLFHANGFDLIHQEHFIFYRLSIVFGRDKTADVVEDRMLGDPAGQAFSSICRPWDHWSLMSSHFRSLPIAH